MRIFDTLFCYIRNYPTAPQALRLRWRGHNLCAFLNQQGIRSSVWVHFRPQRLAHRWSTAYHIFNGDISIGSLRKLTAGIDLDGNCWYRSEWDDSDISGKILANKNDRILKNATRLGPPGMAYAEEGYKPGDQRRVPNNNSIPVSAHIDGLALDIRIEWEKIGDPWGQEAKQLISRFGLARPVDSEFWHFTLQEAGLA